MPAASKLFWFVSCLTVVFLGLHIMGHQVLEVLFGLIIIDIIILRASHNKIEKSIDFRSNLGDKLSSIESAITDLTKFMKARHENPSAKMPDITLGGIEKAMEQKTTMIQQRFGGDMERMAKKAIDMENRMHQQKKTFSAAIASLDDRLRAMESEPLFEEQL